MLLNLCQVNHQSFNQRMSYEFKDHEIDPNEFSFLLNSKRMGYHLDMVLLLDIILFLTLHSVENKD